MDTHTPCLNCAVLIVRQVAYSLPWAKCDRCWAAAERVWDAERVAIDIDLDRPVLLLVRVSVHHCPACDHFFRAQPPFLRPAAAYTNRVVRSGWPGCHVTRRRRTSPCAWGGPLRMPAKRTRAGNQGRGHGGAEAAARPLRAGEEEGHPQGQHHNPGGRGSLEQGRSRPVHKSGDAGGRTGVVRPAVTARLAGWEKSSPNADYATSRGAGRSCHLATDEKNGS